MPIQPDDDVVMDIDPQPFARLDNLAGDLDVLLAGLRVAAGMVVDKDQRRRAQVERALDHLTGVDRRLVDRPFGHVVVADQHVLGVHVKIGCAYVGNRSLACVSMNTTDVGATGDGQQYRGLGSRRWFTQARDDNSVIDSLGNYLLGIDMPMQDRNENSTLPFMINAGDIDWKADGPQQTLRRPYIR